MDKKTLVITAAVVAALIVGAAYGDRLPVVATVAKKLPGARP